MHVCLFTDYKNERTCNDMQNFHFMSPKAKEQQHTVRQLKTTKTTKIIVQQDSRYTETYTKT